MIANPGKSAPPPLSDHVKSYAKEVTSILKSAPTVAQQLPLRGEVQNLSALSPRRQTMEQREFSDSQKQQFYICDSPSLQSLLRSVSPTSSTTSSSIAMCAPQAPQPYTRALVVMR